MTVNPISAKRKTIFYKKKGTKVQFVPLNDPAGALYSSNVRRDKYVCIYSTMHNCLPFPSSYILFVEGKVNIKPDRILDIPIPNRFR